MWDIIDEDDMEHWLEALFNEMTFKFNGSSDFSLLVKASADDAGTTKTDKFALNIKNRTLSNINKTPFLWSPWHWYDEGFDHMGWEPLPEISTYHILKLTENELVIGIEISDRQLIWFLKKKGYEYH